MISLSAYHSKDKQEVSRKSLKAGLWLDGTFDWVSEESASYINRQMRVLCQKIDRKDATFYKMTIKNSSKELLFPKLMFQYENLLERQTVAFFSPGEKAIYHVGQTGVAVLGGLLNGKGISQYCIQAKKNLYQYGCFKSLTEGVLTFSPLAKGEVSSMFSLEQKIEPNECVEAIAWVIHSESKEFAKDLNHKLLAAGQNLQI
ncbi:hypothetical protein [Peribacillus sp. SCS-155]|uniref:hypothetical protein n=1 Tax=Peribacillus sedimenti TaxID=3115297 RepID=UPI00390688FC